MKKPSVWMVYFYLPPISPWIKALTIDCFYFSDQEVKMEEAMSHTGIRQFYLSLQWLYYFFSFNTCMGWNCLIPTNTFIHGVLALNLWLHAGDDLTNHSYMMCFFSPLHLSSFICHHLCVHHHSSPSPAVQWQSAATRTLHILTFA